MKKVFCIATLIVFTNVSFAEIIIPTNTVIPIRATEAIDSSNAQAGQEVVLVVATNIMIKGETVIKAGAPVVAFVNDAKGAQMAGISGKISLAMRTTVAVDGATVPLSGQMINSGESEVGSTVAVGAILCPLALVNKGKSGRILPGSEIRAMSLGDISVDTDNPINIEYRSIEYVKEEPKKTTRLEEDPDGLF